MSHRFLINVGGDFITLGAFQGVDNFLHIFLVKVRQKQLHLVQRLIGVNARAARRTYHAAEQLRDICRVLRRTI